VDGRRDVCRDIDPIIGVDGVGSRVVRHGCNLLELFKLCTVRSNSAERFKSYERLKSFYNDKYALWVLVSELAIYTINVEHRHGVIGPFNAGDAPQNGPLGVLLVSEQQGYSR
jgi:hypothetical protein